MWIVFAHVLFVFLGFAFTVGVGVAWTSIVRSGDVRAIRAATRACTPLNIAGGILIFIGAVVGGVAAARLGFDFHSLWIEVSVVIVAILLLDGFVRRRANLRNVAAAAAASPDDSPSPALRAFANDRIEAIMGPVSGLLWITLLIMMTVKP